LRIKEQATCLTLHEHDENDDDDYDSGGMINNFGGHSIIITGKEFI
jgi:hypothetical protein